jgi:hypothetical protein
MRNRSGANEADRPAKSDDARCRTIAQHRRSARCERHDTFARVSAIASKEDFNGAAAVASYLDCKGKTTIDTATHGNKDKIMKLTAMALATVFALSGTAAFAHTYHHRSDANHYRNAYDQYGMSDEQPTFHLRPNNGNPNGNPDGPTTLSGTGDSQWGGSTPGTSGYN